MEYRPKTISYNDATIAMMQCNINSTFCCFESESYMMAKKFETIRTQYAVFRPFHKRNPSYDFSFPPHLALSS